MHEETTVSILVIDTSPEAESRIRRVLPKASVTTFNPELSHLSLGDLISGSYEILLMDATLGLKADFKQLENVDNAFGSPYLVLLTETPLSPADEKAMAQAGFAEALNKTGITLLSFISLVERALEHKYNQNALTPFLTIAHGHELSGTAQYRINGVRLPFNDNEIAHGIDLDGFMIQRLIGVGGTSSIYLAMTNDGKPVALKMLKLSSTDDERMVDRFVDEYQIGRTLTHQNIVKVYDQQFTDEFIFLVMEYLPGGNLKQFMGSPLGRHRTLKYARQIAVAIRGLHEHNIIHRDIKPSNFQCDMDGVPVLIDFGLAKSLKYASDLTREGEMLGTPHYMSPEQILAKPVDERSDLYSLGVIMYKMLTGSPPFKATSMVDLMQKYAYDPVPRLPDKFGGLAFVVNKLLQKDPDRRYQSINEVEAALEVLDEGREGLEQ